MKKNFLFLQVNRNLYCGYLSFYILQVYSLFVDLLPLTQDLGEYETVMQCYVDTMYPHYKQLVSCTVY